MSLNIRELVKRQDLILLIVPAIDLWIDHFIEKNYWGILENPNDDEIRRLLCRYHQLSEDPVELYLYQNHA